MEIRAVRAMDGGLMAFSFLALADVMDVPFDLSYEIYE